MSLKSELSFSAIGSVGTRIIYFVVFIGLAKLLSPEAFGVIAILNVLNVFSMIFVEMGTGAALINNQNATKYHYNTAWILNLFIGFFFFIIIYHGASYIATFYQKSELEFLIKVFSIVFVINSSSIVPISVLQKNGQFSKIAGVELVAIVLSSILAIIMALGGLEVWSLLFLLMSKSILRTTIFYCLSPFRIFFFFGMKEFFELWNYTKYVLGSKFLDFCVNNLDTIILGKVGSTFELGLYNTAYRLMTLPRDVIGSVFNRVLLSRYARHQQEKNVVKIIHLKTCKFVSMITFPINVAVLILSDFIVSILFGDNWSRMADMLELFSIITFLHSIGIMNGSIYLSQGKTKLQFYTGVFIKIVNILAVIIGSFWGVYGILYSLVISMLITIFPNMYIVGKIINLNLTEFFKNLFSVFIPAIVSGITTFYLKKYLYNNCNVLNFLILIIFFVSVYLIFLVCLNMKFIKKDILSSIK